MTFPFWPAGKIITTEELDSREPVTIIKSLDQSHTNNASITDDTELTFPVVAGAYRVTAVIHATGAQAGDIKIAWSSPSGTGGIRGCYGPNVGSTDRAATSMRASGHVLTTEVAYGVTETTGFATITEQLAISVVTAGNVTIRHAQNATNGTATTVRAYSFLTYWRVG